MGDVSCIWAVKHDCLSLVIILWVLYTAAVNLNKLSLGDEEQNYFICRLSLALLWVVLQ